MVQKKAVKKTGENVFFTIIVILRLHFRYLGLRGMKAFHNFPHHGIKEEQLSGRNDSLLLHFYRQQKTIKHSYQWGAAKHRGSVHASHPAASGSILRVPKKFLFSETLIWCCRDSSTATLLRESGGQCKA